MIRAAGVLFLDPEGCALFLKRGADGDHPGEWCFPGGKIEDGETVEAAAVRECIEEIGSLPEGVRTVLARRIAPADIVTADSVDFTTFQQKVARFEPILNDEHVGFAWAPVDQPPEPLHPGCRIVLARLSMDELGVARAMAAGELASPQTYANVGLFAIRITGTGVSYRRAHEEFVWRDPSIYLNDEFLARCNGLAVIMEHPKKSSALTSDEFNKRIVGMVMLPYIKGDEVWGIAKIYDSPAREMMEEHDLSTSPAVVFLDPTVNSKMKLEDGSTLLIEGKPGLLDHVAICELGVWDKGGEPSGIASASQQGDLIVMTDEEKAKLDAEEKARKDAADEEAKKTKADSDAGEKLDKLLSMMDSMQGRMDGVCNRMDTVEAAEKSRADAAKKDDDDTDPKKVAADKARKDAEEADRKEREKADADRTRADADLAKRIADVEKSLPRQLTDEDRHALATSQARADSVFQMYGQSASHPMNGEGLLDYRRRLAKSLQPHSTKWKDVKLDAIADDVAFSNIESGIYDDARLAALNPVDLPGEMMRGITMTDSVTGLRSTRFVGKHSFVRDFTHGDRFMTDLNVNRNH